MPLIESEVVPGTAQALWDEKDGSLWRLYFIVNHYIITALRTASYTNNTGLAPLGGVVPRLTDGSCWTTVLEMQDF